MVENILFTVKECPLCYKSHTYEFKVTYDEIALSGGKSVNERKRDIKRLLPCPTKSKLFTAILELTETSKSQIKSVKVERIVEDDDDEK